MTSLETGAPGARLPRQYHREGAAACTSARPVMLEISFDSCSEPFRVEKIETRRGWLIAELALAISLRTSPRELQYNGLCVAMRMYSDESYLLLPAELKGRPATKAELTGEGVADGSVQNSCKSCSPAIGSTSVPTGERRKVSFGRRRGRDEGRTVSRDFHFSTGIERVYNRASLDEGDGLRLDPFDEKR